LSIVTKLELLSSGGKILALLAAKRLPMGWAAKCAKMCVGFSLFSQSACPCEPVK